ncbi:hypothetical protein ACP70R_016235 [Stipagrostis hirtigluma subsp. patula]
MEQPGIAEGWCSTMGVALNCYASYLFLLAFVIGADVRDAAADDVTMLIYVDTDADDC